MHTACITCGVLYGSASVVKSIKDLHVDSGVFSCSDRLDPF